MNTARNSLLSALLMTLTLAACADENDVDPNDVGDDEADRATAYAPPQDAGTAYWQTIGDAAHVDPATVPDLLDAPPPACAGKFALPGDPESGYRIAQWGTCSFLCETYRGAYAERRRVSDLRGVCAALGGVCAGAVGDALCIPAP